MGIQEKTEAFQLEKEPSKQNERKHVKADVF